MSQSKVIIYFGNIDDSEIVEIPVAAIAGYYKKGLKDFTKFTGKHLCQSPFFNKVAGLRPATLLKKRLWQRYFPVNFAKFLRTTFLQNTYE